MAEHCIVCGMGDVGYRVAELLRRLGEEVVVVTLQAREERRRTAESLGVRIVMAWIVGSLLVLGSFNHAVVGTIELFYALRFGGDIGWDQIATNLGTSIAGNLVGGLLLVTFARSAQALGASRAS